MTSREYLAYVAVLVFLVVGSFVCLNLYLNDFALFGDRDKVRIWGFEKTSKYLLSFNYIPKNFEGVLVGPSVSVNMNTKNIGGFKIYNLSMNSGNISELKYPLDNILQSGGIKYLVICLYPYMTKNSGVKGREIDEKEYWGSLYSFIPLHLILRRIKVALWPADDVFHDSDWGFNDSNIKKRNFVFNNFVLKRRKNPRKDIYIDPIAYSELGKVVSLAHRNGVKILAYYYPMYFEYADVFRESGALSYYKNKINALFSKEDYVWDMNIPQYSYITHDQNSYVDGHLSDFGANRVLKVIEEKLIVADQND